MNQSHTPPGGNGPIVYRHWAADLAPKTAPALATSTVLILARIWNANGAQHSIGDASVMGVLAVGAAFAGNALARGENGQPVAAAVGFTAAGTFALAGVAAYTDTLPLPLLLWSVATVLAYVLAHRHWRTERLDTVAYDRGATDRRETQRHVETVEIIRARAQVDTARAALPGFDPAALTVAGLPELPNSAGKDAA